MKIKNNTKKWCMFSILILSTSGALYFLLKNHRNNNASEAKFLTKKNAYFIPIQIKSRSSGDIPCLEVKIEDKTIAAEMDTGYEGDVCLPAEILQNLNEKKYLGCRPSYALTGKTYKSNVYEVEKIDIENMTFFPIKAEEINQEFANDIKLGEKKESIECVLGRIGWCLFHNFNLLIDCEHSTIALCDSFDSL